MARRRRVPYPQAADRAAFLELAAKHIVKDLPTISEDKLVYDFTLRDGLLFHDGSAVRGIDCVASLKRWMARDSLGNILVKFIDEMKARVPIWKKEQFVDGATWADGEPFPEEIPRGNSNAGGSPGTEGASK